jgi:hypothetical protein
MLNREKVKIHKGIGTPVATPNGGLEVVLFNY